MAAIVNIQIKKIEKVRFCAHLPKQKTWRLSADDQDYNLDGNYGSQ